MTERGKFAPNAEVYGPDYYARMYRPHWFLRSRRKYEERDAALLRIVRPDPSARVLEVGSARGDTAFFLAPHVARVVGIDAAPAAVAARREQEARGIANVTFEEADARDLARVPGGPFDVVLLADFVEHVLDDVLVACLASARGVLKRGGALAIYTPNRDHWAERIKAAVPGLQQEDHIAVRPAARVVALALAAGFRAEDLFFSASPYPLLGAMDRALPMVGLCRFRTCLRAVPSPREGSAMKVSFVTCDVFTDRPFTGNPLLVVPDARGLRPFQMQSIAREINYSESTFVLPAKDAAHAYWQRTFVPVQEIPYAGHPTVGTAVAMAALGHVARARRTASCPSRSRSASARCVSSS